MTTAEQRIPLLPSAAASVLKSLGNQVHPADDSVISSNLSNSGKIILQPSVPDTWACMAQVASSRFAYDSLFQNGVGAYGRYVERYQPFDLSVLAGSRRKNATRETTSTLKAWLHEHRKNPYPTKGEKIMLAILTKMTLTQVSTWFANARRRLKKENKMTWLPRNKSGSREGDKNAEEENGERDNLNSDSDDNDSDFELDDEKMATDDANLGDFSPNDEAKSLKDSETEEMDTKPQLEQNLAHKDAKTKTNKLLESSDWNFAPETPKSSDSILSGIGNSPVNSLQRWVNVCFETQSPVDFPKELTPPHTPIEHKKQGTAFALSSSLPVKDEKDDSKIEVITSSVVKKAERGVDFTDIPENSLTLSSLARLTETRPCILTSHRELDAVLALTSLASR